MVSRHESLRRGKSPLDAVVVLFSCAQMFAKAAAHSDEF